MINLLPESERKLLSRDYARRTIVVGLALSAAAFFMSLVFLVPSYLSVRGSYEAALTRQKALDRSPFAKEEVVVARALDIDRKLAALNLSAKKPSAAAALERLAARRTPGIAVTTISYDRRTSGIKMDVGGTARDRESLVRFVESLKQEPTFSEVFSPVSNLIKDKDIDFVVSIVLAP